MKKVNFLIAGLSLTAAVFGMEKSSSPISVPIAVKKEFSIAVVGKNESNDFLARRKSSNSFPRVSRSRLSSSPEFPCGVIDGKVIPSQKLAENKDKK